MSECKPGRAPRHIGIIMDGNNRWAKQRRMPSGAGHKAGVERIRDVLEAGKQLDIEVLTLFAFSSENWRRPEREVDALMKLFLWYLKNEVKKLKKEGVALRVIGRRDRFSNTLLKAIDHAEHATAGGIRTLVIAADYGGRWDIANAAKAMTEYVINKPEEFNAIDEDSLGNFMQLSNFPPLDLLIRTGGEQRISNFLLWQAAYAELYFSPLLWPEFDGDALAQAVDDFYSRQRRFGMTSEQVQTKSC